MLPRMLSYGMFFDGVTYASIARNMAEGYGSFWIPYYSDTVYRVFYEQLPFGLWLQSIAFRVFGDSSLVEQFWGFFSGIIVLWLIVLIWNENYPHDDNRRNSWSPVLLFTSIPLFVWMFSSNMLEITMTVFVLLSAYLCIKSLREERVLGYVILAFASGLCILGAVLTKGPVGFFPLVIPFLGFLIIKEVKLKRAVIITLIMVGSIAAVLLFILTNKEAVEFLSRYLETQVFASLSGARKNVETHLHSLKIISREIIVPLIIAILFSVVFFIKDKAKIRLKVERTFLFYLLIAFCGSLPVMISSKQMSWYIVPSFPFYALAIAYLFENYSNRLQNLVVNNLKATRVMFILSAIFFLASIVIMFSEKDVLRKNKEFHNDFSVQKFILEERQIISVYPKELATDWGLVANMQRFYRTSLSDSLGYKYLLTLTDSTGSKLINTGYYKIHPQDPMRFVLFKRKY
jgi:4-amino-4-deoxy-L-arabinose transferase-like glycosyltransferase